MEISDCVSLIAVSNKVRRYILAEVSIAFDVFFTQLTGGFQAVLSAPTSRPNLTSCHGSPEKVDVIFLSLEEECNCARKCENSVSN